MGVGLPLVENVGGAQSTYDRPIPLTHLPRLTVQRTPCMADLTYEIGVAPTHWLEGTYREKQPWALEISTGSDDSPH